MSLPQQQPSSIFELNFPQSVGIYQTYEDAQKAVDYLSDNKFAVQNLAIVGTDLKSFERVLGRKSWGTVIGQGVQSGITMGLLVGLVFLIFAGGRALVLVAVALGIGLVLGIASNAFAYSLSRGRRDFTSVTQTVATKYEVLCEHKVAQQARDMLQQMPGARANLF
ncbi:putative membrane protein [Friedmanniella endophytica]|uniref:Putative membrane protein n=1 Tax=Microlunatus kandeliicorticis TaxID=1759536 RepID=A0A7W3ISI5_9ACTN|nr:general stress protein [Microlunatus kandeliicorticis]MBA8794468.1 putative membrane protein [Microlunatus kandeliicorticis]